MTKSMSPMEVKVGDIARMAMLRAGGHQGVPGTQFPCDGV